MKPMTVEEVLNAVEGRVIALGDVSLAMQRKIGHITQDSREVTKDSLFLAIQGERMDGHDFILQCFEKGVAACLSEKEIMPPEGGVLILVPNVKKALLQLAKHYKEKFPIPFIAITGSVGKTTTKDMLAAVLSQRYNTLWTQGNYNNDLGVPLTLFRLEEAHEIAVIEMGMNHFGEIHALVEVVRPQLGLISNVGVAHIEHLGSREGILQAKCELFDFMGDGGVAVLNGDNDMLQRLENKLPRKVRWFGLENKRDIYADQLQPVGMDGTKCKIHTEKGAVEVFVPMPGEHMILNALSAAAVGLEMNLTPEEIKKGIESFVPTKNRMNIIRMEDETVILNDVYNANPVSMKASLDILAGGDGRKVAIIGFMGELGAFAEKMHEEVGEYAAKKDIDLILCIGKHSENTVFGAKGAGAKEAYAFVSQEEFLEKGFHLLQPKDIILIKGSRSMQLEKTVEKIQGVN